MNKLKTLFGRQTVTNHAEQDLYEAERGLITAHAHFEYTKAQVSMYTERVQRLRNFLKQREAA